MKILTWNINGIRASKVPLKKLFDSLDADIICLQETKVTRDQLDERSAIVDGYNSYFSFSKARSGYSGVATFVRDGATPVKAEEGLTGLLSDPDELQSLIGCYGDQSEFTDEELASLDNEGRSILTQHRMMSSDGEEKLLTVVNVYCPRADPERDDRRSFKLRFYKLLQLRAEAILGKNSHVIVLGDVNTSHCRIDNCDPGKDFEDHPGRKWMDGFLWEPPKEGDESSGAPDNETDTPGVTSSQSTTGGAGENQTLNTSGSLDVSSTSPTKDVRCPGKGEFIDSFRFYHPTQKEAYTCWSTATGAREFNYGTRIDYILGDKCLVQEGFEDCVIMPDVQGSDHCPVHATLSWEVVAAPKPPPLCTRYLPEFTGKQQKLLAFFKRGPSKTQPASMEQMSESQSGLSTKDTKETWEVSGSQEDASNLTSSQNSDGKTVTKRLLSDSSPVVPKAKKQKLEKQSSGGKQKTLANFFIKPTKSKSTESGISDLDKARTVDTNGSKKCHQETSDISQIKTDGLQDVKHDTDSEMNDKDSQDKPGCEISGEKQVKLQSDKKGVAGAWKNLLGGPAPAPLCKGHKEPCVLRTVKKDGLNKGRQFYVCARGEGPRSNPESRCDHFVWVEKKRKTIVK